jgi:hypothetical protein
LKEDRASAKSNPAAWDDGGIGRHSRLESLSRSAGNDDRDALKVGELFALVRYRERPHDDAEPSALDNGAGSTGSVGNVKV